MSIQKFMAAQFRQPTGWFGSLVITRMMNRVNRKIAERTIELLRINAPDRVLEIGFGGGIALSLLLEQFPSAAISGVDFSADMVRCAERQFRAAVASGRLELKEGEVSRLPYSDGTFKQVFTINAIYFWPDVRRGLTEIRRVLAEGGRAAVSIRSKDKMSKYGVTKHGFTLYTGEEVAVLMREVGFRDIAVDRQDPDHWYDQVVILGTR
jgi:arsenite methyltransferase